MFLNPTQSRIADFLAKGLKPSQIASIVGVTAGYISQVQSMEGFADEVESRAEAIASTAEGQLEEQVLSDKYLAVEHKVLKQVEESLQYAEFPMLVNALKVLGDRRVNMEKTKAVKSAVGAGAAGAGVSITILQLPQHAIAERVVAEQNNQGQITSIGGRVLAPLSSAATRTLFDSMNTPAPEALPAMSEAQQALDF